MSFPYTPRLQDVKVESLETQLDYLNLLRLRHLHWMSASEDPGVREFHARIAKGLEEITGSYGTLLNTLHTA